MLVMNPNSGNDVRNQGEGKRRFMRPVYILRASHGQAELGLPSRQVGYQDHRSIKVKSQLTIVAVTSFILFMLTCAQRNTFCASPNSNLSVGECQYLVSTTAPGCGTSESHDLSAFFTIPGIRGMLLQIASYR